MKRLISLNKYYLVTQTYSRYSDHPGDKKNGILLSDYEDYAMAKTHWDALKTDPFRAVLDLHKPEHVNKIVEMLSSASKFALFWAVVSDVDRLQKHINEKYADNFRHYIEQHTNWRIGSDKSLRPSLQLIFGELFIILKFSGQTIRVKFEEIENT